MRLLRVAGVWMSGDRMTVHAPVEAGTAVEVVVAAEGGGFVLDVLRPEGAAGSVVLRVQGQEDGLSLAEGQIVVDGDGRVRLTLAEYIQAGAAFKAIAELAGSVLARLDALEARCQCGAVPATDPDGYMGSTAPETGPAPDETVAEGGTRRWPRAGRCFRSEGMRDMNPDDNTTFPLSDDQIEAIACACHEVNRAYCAVIGDNSQVAWADAPEWQRESAKMGILRVYNNSTPEELHQSWCDQKVADGWRYGPFKDADQKVHPCLVPYSELPAEQKVKDDLFQTTAGALLAVVKGYNKKET